MHLRSVLATAATITLGQVSPSVAACALFFSDTPPVQMDPAPHQCGQALTTSGAGWHCHWAFEYRETAAVAAFDALADRVEACLSGTPDTRAAAPVNHPDTHTVRRFRTDGKEVVVSLKDKAALGQTLVFLRVSPAP